MEDVKVGERQVEGDLVRLVLFLFSLSLSFSLNDMYGILNSFFVCYGRNELDANDPGGLTKDAFVQGMLRIDEELRKQRNKPPSSNTRLRLPPSRATTLLI